MKSSTIIILSRLVFITHSITSLVSGCNEDTCILEEFERPCSWGEGAVIPVPVANCESSYACLTYGTDFCCTDCNINTSATKHLRGNMLSDIPHNEEDDAMDVTSLVSGCTVDTCIPEGFEVPCSSGESPYLYENLTGLDCESPYVCFASGKYWCCTNNGDCSSNTDTTFTNNLHGKMVSDVPSTEEADPVMKVE